MENLILGIFALGYGLYTTSMRVANKFQTSEKLTQMKIKFGEKAGNIIHLVFYTVLPLALGIVMLYKYYLIR